MAAGRPSIYDASTVAKAVSSYIASAHKNKLLPTVEGLAVHMQVARDTIYDWDSKYPEFSDILEQMKAAQASQLIQNALVGNYNSTITKLLLSKHKGHDGLPYVDRKDITSDNKPLLIGLDDEASEA